MRWLGKFTDPFAHGYTRRHGASGENECMAEGVTHSITGKMRSEAGVC